MATASVSWLITCLRRNPGRPSNHRDASSCWQSACATNYTFHSYYDVHPYHHHHHHQRRLHSYHQQAHLTNWTLCHAVSLPQPTYLNTVQFSYEKTKHAFTIERCNILYLNKAFIDIRLRPGIATPLVVICYRYSFSLPRIAIRPITTKRDAIQKTGST